MPTQVKQSFMTAFFFFRTYVAKHAALIKKKVPTTVKVDGTFALYVFKVFRFL